MVAYGWEATESGAEREESTEKTEGGFFVFGWRKTKDRKEGVLFVEFGGKGGGDRG